jgi:hypothetical protein
MQECLAHAGIGRIVTHACGGRDRHCRHCECRTTRRDHPSRRLEPHQCAQGQGLWRRLDSAGKISGAGGALSRGTKGREPSHQPAASRLRRHLCGHAGGSGLGCAAVRLALTTGVCCGGAGCLEPDLRPRATQIATRDAPEPPILTGPQPAACDRPLERSQFLRLPLEPPMDAAQWSHEFVDVPISREVFGCAVEVLM